MRLRFLLFPDVHHTQGAYFSMGNLKLTIPSFVSKEHRVLTHLYTLPHEAADENHVSANVGRETSNKATGPNKTLKYVLHDNKNHFEIVDGKNLAFTEAFIRRSGEDKSKCRCF